ncbi:MAG TPA: hypothetical protein VF615_09050 [Longimicrobiaceae bacterium]|jgi:hypothetical protein
MLRELLSLLLGRVPTPPAADRAEHRERHGVALAVEADGDEAEALWRRLDAALELIAAHRPVWLARMRRMGTRVLVRRTPGTRARLVDGELAILDSYFVSTFLPAQVAASMVHEATHARLRFCGFATEALGLAREERACRRSELRLGRALLAAGVEGAAAVVERAEAALAAPDRDVGVAVDWGALRAMEAAEDARRRRERSG